MQPAHYPDPGAVAVDGEWLARFPDTQGPERHAIELLRGRCHRIVHPARSIVFAPGAMCTDCLMVLDGIIRVQQIAEGGREIVRPAAPWCSRCCWAF